MLQKQQSTSLDRFRQQAKELKVTVGRDLEEASKDSAGMFFTVLYYAVLCTSVLYCTVLYCLYDTALNYDIMLKFNELHTATHYLLLF